MVAPGLLHEPRPVYELRAAACQLSRAVWNAGVVAARGGVLAAGQLVSDTARQSEAAVHDATAPAVHGALSSAREARAAAEAGVAHAQASLLGAVDGAASAAASAVDGVLAQAASVLPEALRPRQPQQAAAPAPPPAAPLSTGAQAVEELTAELEKR